MREQGGLSLHSPGVSSGLRVTPQHFTSVDLENIFSKGYFNYSFSIVRNPFTKIESEYRMRYILSADGHFGTFTPFPVWLENVLSQARNNIGFLDNHLRPQWTFVGKSVKVFRFEDGIESILRGICRDLSIEPPKKVEHKLSTKKFDGEIEWGPIEIERVLEFYQHDFNRFCYPPEI